MHSTAIQLLLIELSFPGQHFPQHLFLLRQQNSDQICLCARIYSLRMWFLRNFPEIFLKTQSFQLLGFARALLISFPTASCRLHEVVGVFALLDAHHLFKEAHLNV